MATNVANQLIRVGDPYDTNAFILGDIVDYIFVEIIPKVTEVQMNRLSPSANPGFKVQNTDRGFTFIWDGLAWCRVPDTVGGNTAEFITVTTGDLYVTSLTQPRVVFVGLGGKLVDNADFYFDNNNLFLTNGYASTSLDSYFNGVRVGMGGSNQFSNTVVGSGALESNVVGTKNTAVGFQALNTNRNGIDNTAIGYQALLSNLDGSHNIAIGSGALDANDNDFNIAIGFDTLTELVGGFRNIAIGAQAMSTAGSFGFGDNIAIGYQSLMNTYGSNNVAIGSFAMTTTINSSDNIAIGLNAAHSDYISAFNVAIGTNSLYSNTEGLSNIAIGYETLYSLVGGLNEGWYGRGNIALGDQAGKYLRGSNYNVSLGFNASFGDSSPVPYYNMGDENIAIGHSAHYAAGGQNNIAVGTSTLYNTIQGDYNIAVGFGVAQSLNVSYNNIGIGQNALFGSPPLLGVPSSVSDNIAIGQSSLFKVGIIEFTDINDNNALYYYSGSNNIAIGRNSLYNNVTGLGNIAIGDAALNKLTGVDTSLLPATATGYHNIGIGASALGNTTQGIQNIALGVFAGYGKIETDLFSPHIAGSYNFSVGSGAFYNGGGDYNIAIGHSALNNQGDIAGSNNIAIGRYALTAITSSTENIAIGNEALYYAQTGDANTVVGTLALDYARHPSNNTIFGYHALSGINNFGYASATVVNNTVIGSLAAPSMSGTGNIALGYKAFSGVGAGTQNIGIGEDTYASQTFSGTYNIALGVKALRRATSANSNIAIGNDAIGGLTTGQYVVAIGEHAGDYGTDSVTLTSMTNSVFIGYYATSTANSIDNSIAIGYNAQVTGSNQVTIGNSAVTTTKLFGAVTATSFNLITALSSSAPLMDSIATIGTSTTVARADHIHPTDTSRAADLVFVASGVNHSKGLVPDPGAVAGTIKYLREDATWQIPPFTPSWRMRRALY